MPSSVNGRLLVEGSDDQHVVWQICQQHAVPETFDVAAIEGVDALLTALPEFILDSRLRRLGVMLDADDALQARWRRLSVALAMRGYSDVPGAPVPVGTIVPTPDADFLPTVGIWLMPDNEASGALEDFLMRLVGAEDALLAHARLCVGSLPDGLRRFIPAHRGKAEIRTWLAWQEEAGLPFGTALKAGYLDANHPDVQAFVRWLTLLFSPDGAGSNLDGRTRALVGE